MIIPLLVALLACLRLVNTFSLSVSWWFPLSLTLSSCGCLLFRWFRLFRRGSPRISLFWWFFSLFVFCAQTSRNQESCNVPFFYVFVMEVRQSHHHHKKGSEREAEGRNGHHRKCNREKRWKREGEEPSPPQIRKEERKRSHHRRQERVVNLSLSRVATPLTCLSLMKNATTPINIS